MEHYDKQVITLFEKLAKEMTDAELILFDDRLAAGAFNGPFEKEIRRRARRRKQNHEN
jgi:hypothetical protein